MGACSSVQSHRASARLVRLEFAPEDWIECILIIGASKGVESLTSRPDPDAGQHVCAFLDRLRPRM